MTRSPDFCVCESCSQPGSIALFRSTVPTSHYRIALPGGEVREFESFAIALCVACGQRSGFPRFFDAAPAPVAQAVSA